MTEVLGSWKARSAAIAGAAASRGAGVVRSWEWQANHMLTRPTSEWAFVNMNKIFPSERVDRASNVTALPERRAHIDFSYSFDGGRYSLDDFHRRTYSTAFVILHKGALLHEAIRASLPGAASVSSYSRSANP